MLHVGIETGDLNELVARMEANGHEFLTALIARARPLNGGS
jgi:hypothetical protein